MIYNRLRDHMPLQLDATTRYATGNYTKPLTDAQLNSSSPYNTRNHAGLPPTPINSPGLSALQAAAHPATTDDLYFFAKHCSDKTVFFSNYTRVPERGQRRRRDRLQEVGHRCGSGCSGGRWRTAARRRCTTRRWRRSGCTTGAISCCRSRRSCWTRPCRRCARAGFRGANVTIPHKAAALALATDRTERAAAIGAANTLTFEPGGEIVADNTDAPALIAALPFVARGRTAVVLGAGGSARAVVWALAGAGAREVLIWNRSPPRARELADELGATALEGSQPPPDADILVNCTSVGLDGGDPFGPLPLTADRLPSYRLRRRPRLHADGDAADRCGRVSRRRDRRRPRDPRRAGGAELRAVHRSCRAPVDVMRAAARG